MTGPARLAALAGGAAWCGGMLGWSLRATGIVAIGMAVAPIAVGALRQRLPPSAIVVATVAVAAAVSGSLAAARHGATMDATVPTGRAHVVGIVADEPQRRGDELWVVLGSVEHFDPPGRSAPIAVVWKGPDVPGPGDTVAARGRLTNHADIVRGDPVAGRLTATEARVVVRANGPFHRAAAAMRRRVDTVLAPHRSDPVGALLAGFLVGDTSHLTKERIDALRAAGLSHFVAVSGSNVALFLAAWWILLTPFAGPRTRAVVGIAGIVLFIVVTRWEPSVLRAGTMVGLILVGRVAGVPVDPTVALGWGVAGLLLVSGELAPNVGFQLSAAATVGVMVGVRWAADRRPRWMWSILAATGGAQVAVAPIALYHFGSIPLMAPLANLIAAPLVTAATGLGGAAILLGGGPILALARIPSMAVLRVADLAAGWPQLDWAAAGVVAATVAVGRVRRLRVVAAAAFAGAVLLAWLSSGAHPGATLTVLDVGQGDAILVRDGPVVMLIDGGRDPTVLAEALIRHRAERIDMMVVTHGDADHAAGLIGLIERAAVGEVWVPAFGERGAYIDAIVASASLRGVPVVEVGAGMAATVGRLSITALGPGRRYKSDNDGAIALWIDAGPTRVLLPSDLEAVAQAELPPLRPDVLVVPHHGSSTTDPRWLAQTTGEIAILSVGSNTYGHPDPTILDVLADEGVSVLSTMEVGDVVVALLPQ